MIEIIIGPLSFSSTPVPKGKVFSQNDDQFLPVVFKIQFEIEFVCNSYSYSFSWETLFPKNSNVFWFKGGNCKNTENIERLV